MTQFSQRTFSVATGSRPVAGCEHGMVRKRDGQCCFCGATAEEVRHAMQARANGQKVRDSAQSVHLPSSPPRP